MQHSPSLATRLPNMNRPIGGGPGVRNLSSFPSQSPARGSAQSNASRTQNGKLGGASQWGFGMVSSGPPGVLNAPARPLGSGSSFAQTVGSSQSASLDPSDFPSLSGAPQSQYSNSGPAIWANQRGAQPSAVQRPSQATPVSATSSRPSHRHPEDSAQLGLDEGFFSTNPGSSIEDFRHDAHASLDQMNSGSRQAGGVEEFPPLGQGSHGEVGQDRRMAILQNATAGGFSTTSAFGPGNARTAAGSSRPSQDKGLGSRPFSNGTSDTSLLSSLNHQSRAPGRDQTHGDRGPAGRDPDESAGNDEHGRSNSPDQMSELDRFGLPGLLEMVRSDNPDVASLAIGHDLTTLGLDLNSLDPLHATFAGPFAAFPTRPLRPDYVLPPCYTVANTHPVEEKLAGLSDETLFFIFYSITRDVLQEQAATELNSRNWRFHKEMGAWITKEQGLDPQPLGPEAERGRYTVFNHKTWQRESKDLLLYYADLDTHLATGQPGNAHVNY